MPKLDELPADVWVAFFGKPWDERCTPDIKIPCPEEELCHRCTFIIGLRTTGAAVRTGEGGWVYYHRDCYWAHLEEVQSVQYVADELDGDAEDLEDFR